MAKGEKEDMRRTYLQKDPYVGEVAPHRVTCKACGIIIRLDPTYKYEASHWRAHRARCAQIPFGERVPEKPKRRRFGYRKKRQYQETIAMENSEDSDVSSQAAPRPPPTAVFTASLEINVSNMFLPHAPPDKFPTHTVDDTKAKREVELLARLEKLADNLSTSDRLAEIINAAGDGITTEDRLGKGHVVDHEEGDSDGDAVCDEEVRPRQRSPTPDHEAWIPRKRTRDEEAEFDAFFNKRPRPESPIPTGKLWVCKLDKEAMQIIEQAVNGCAW
jgi:hypothetical protein